MSFGFLLHSSQSIKGGQSLKFASRELQIFFKFLVIYYIYSSLPILQLWVKTPPNPRQATKILKQKVAV